jgi:hypothetical protein
MKILLTIAALTFGLALVAAPAQASDRTILFEVKPVDRPVSCAGDDQFGLPFEMVAPGGATLGPGQSCVHSTVGCLPFRPFCHQTVDATFTLGFASGSVIARMTLRELLPSESLVVQRGKGTITSGARGTVEGGGVVEFTDTGLDSALFYAVRLTH